jgi:pectin methylesterase-like acyl-CoA thioesterase
MNRQRRCFQNLWALTGILLSLWATGALAQPATGQKPSSPDPRTVIPANLFVDDDNAGAQDGSALHPYRTVQQAINAAKGDAVIAVAAGTYPENIRVGRPCFNPL